MSKEINQKYPIWYFGSLAVRQSLVEAIERHVMHDKCFIYIKGREEPIVASMKFKDAVEAFAGVNHDN